MTIVQVKHVVSCSSEDTLHKADNLLKADSYKKWTCSTEGEKQASVILQLEKSSKIHSIDVGNESSAFVEILGGHSSSDTDNFQVILVTSSFMSPLESRNNTNTNRVRMFGPESLSKAVADKKFDRIKVVCTQPFNKRCKYGLSFLKLHGPPGSGEQQTAGGSSQTQTSLGKFKLKEESKSSLSVGTFFKNRDQDVHEPQKPLTGAAAVRAAATVAATSATVAATSSPGTSSKSPQAIKQASVKRPLPEDEREEGRNNQKKVSRNEPSPGTAQRAASRETTSHTAKESTPKPATGDAFGRLMKRVVFVLSGFQHPDRGNLRQKAVEMGATYQGDWGPGCTHLICAFANTPKYNQVKGKGKIVKKGWIMDCYRKRVLLQWQRYKLYGGNESSTDESESEEEEEEEQEEEEKKRTPVKVPPTSRESPEKKMPTPKKPSPVRSKQAADDEYGGSTDEESNNTEPIEGGSSGDDTEDEIRRIRAKPAQSAKDPGSSPGDIPDLPDFFSKKHFLLFGKFESEERRQVNRFITAFNGLIENYMNDQVDYVITNSSWDSNFEQALSANAALTFVRPRWLFACSEKLKMVPYQPYIVVPAN